MATLTDMGFLIFKGYIQYKLDIIVMGTITGAPLWPFCVLATEV